MSALLGLMVRESSEDCAERRQRWSACLVRVSWVLLVLGVALLVLATWQP